MDGMDGKEGRKERGEWIRCNYSNLLKITRAAAATTTTHGCGRHKQKMDREQARTSLYGNVLFGFVLLPFALLDFYWLGQKNTKTLLDNGTTKKQTNKNEALPLSFLITLTLFFFFFIILNYCALL
jgi:hypothetical protein